MRMLLRVMQVMLHALLQVMLWGTVYMHKRYKPMDYVLALTITLVGCGAAVARAQPCAHRSPQAGHVFVHIHVYLHVCVMCVCARVFSSLRACMSVCVCMCVCARMPTCARMCANMCTPFGFQSFITLLAALTQVLLSAWQLDFLHECSLRALMHTPIGVHQWAWAQGCHLCWMFVLNV